MLNLNRSRNTKKKKKKREGKKTRKRNFQHTRLFGREKNKKEIEKLYNWQG